MHLIWHTVSLNKFALSLTGLLFDFVIVHSAASHSSLAGPGVDLGTGLAGAHVPDAALMPQIANLGAAAPLWSLL